MRYILIEKIHYIITHQTIPYANLALEEYLLKNVSDRECILYLWQNEKTVVIGKNQNPWKECRIAELEKDGGRLVRRLSGGGAVFHDLGNLNFTFLMGKENYDLDKQLEVILRAVNQLGIPAEKSGRNNITVEGRKFSGNAFYSDGSHNYHHGTILVHVDMKQLSHYLNVSRDKLISKGVESVKSRVVNLQEYLPDLSIDRMRKELIRAFGDVYGLKPEPLNQARIDTLELRKLENKFSSWDWIYGRKIAFSDVFERRFPWGNIELQLLVEAGLIKECMVYSDSLTIYLFERIPSFLTGCIYTSKAMVDAIKKINVANETENNILEDLIQMIEQEGI